MGRSMFAAVFLALCIQQANAWCAVVVGESAPFGIQCGSMFSQRSRSTELHMKKVNMYYDSGCVVGIKVQFGYKAAQARLVGKEQGQEKHLIMKDDEYISGVELRAGPKCIEMLKLRTDKGQTFAMGGGPGKVLVRPHKDAYVFGFKGSANGQCAFGIGQLQIIWAIEECNPPSKHLKPAGMPKPAVSIPVPVPRPTSTPVPLSISALPISAFDETADDQQCISDPEEFIRAWRSANPSDRDRCVDSSIIVRLANGDRSWSTLGSVLKGFFGRLGPLSFWAFKDAPEKYLRTGIPRSVGVYTDANPNQQPDDPENAPWAAEAFPGVRKQSNGVSMLTQIGFGSDFYRIDRFYMIFVGKRNKTKMSNAGVPSFVPTWDNLRVFYEDYIRDFIGQQNGALGRPEDFSIPKEVITGVKTGQGFKGLANTDLADLTGCPSQCTYEDRNYPDAVVSDTDRVPALTPGVYTNHTGPDTCDMPVVMAKKTPTDNSSSPEMVDIGADLVKSGRLRIAEPTQLAVNELACTDPDWKRYFLVGDFPGTNKDPYPAWEKVDGAVKWKDNKFPGLYEICKKESKFPGPLFMSAFVNEWKKISPTDYRKQAVLFRAFLMAGCAGNFNQLFSGNGLIYTGHGGVSSATVHELLLGEINYKNAEQRITGDEKLLGNYAFAFFCIDGTENCCPDSNCRSLAKPAWN